MADEGTTVVLLCMRTAAENPEIMKGYPFPWVLDNCADCGCEVSRSSDDLTPGVALGPGGEPTLMELPPGAIILCGWCAADRADADGDWQQAAAIRHTTRTAEGGYTG